MKQLTCKGCNGVYADMMSDGTRYFHVCPPSVAPADRRDENPISTDAKDSTSIKAAGKGTAVV